MLDLAEEAVHSHHADQKPAELAALGYLIRGCHARSLIEVGTFRGGTSWFFRALGLEVLTIDTDQSQVAIREPGVHYVEAHSMSARTWTASDVVFIDGDHSYTGVCGDWKRYGPLARQLVVFHDIVDHLPERRCDVARLWQEIKTAEYVTVEIVDPQATASGEPWAGIGVVCV